MPSFSLSKALQLCIFLFLFFSPLVADSELTQGIFADGIQVDLRDPVYSEGVLTTCKGGIISGPNLRIQARNITYTRKLMDDKPLLTIEAHGDLILEFGDYVFVGESIEYDFQTKEGFIYNARTAIEPWFFGGKKIKLCSDGTYIVQEGFITSSENYCSDWQITTSEAVIENKQLLKARGVQFHLFRLPIFWLPSFRINLKTIFDSPVKYRFRWGGKQGTRFGLTYEVFSWNRWQTNLRLDYRLKRGPGGGLETHYRSEDHKTSLDLINYIARDSSLFNPHEKTRYRFQGLYHTTLVNDKITVDFTYDKISDIDMPSDYYDKGIELDTAERTQLHVRRQEEMWIANFWTRVRVNGFQTLKQELPSFDLNSRPFCIGNTGIIAENRFITSYLDFQYADNLINVSDYAATRLEYRPRIYRPITLGIFTITPEVGARGIYYGNSPRHNQQFLGIVKAAVQINTHFYRYYGFGKHVIEPYTYYQYHTYPTSSPHHHYIFDINDGLYRWNMLTFGIRNAIYSKSDACLLRFLSADLFANAFFHTRNVKQTIPKIYGNLACSFSPTLKHIIDTAWDFEKGQLDHLNFRSEWTINRDRAVAIEFRHRDAFSWRKADPTNFFLESFHTVNEMKRTALSDRRDTILFHFFHRFHPNWVYELKLHHGWNRKCEPDYTEYEADLITSHPSGWRIKFSLQHQENDTRFAMYFSLNLQRPNFKQDNCFFNAFD